MNTAPTPLPKPAPPLTPPSTPNVPPNQVSAPGTTMQSTPATTPDVKPQPPLVATPPVPTAPTSAPVAPAPTVAPATTVVPNPIIARPSPPINPTPVAPTPPAARPPTALSALSSMSSTSIPPQGSGTGSPPPAKPVTPQSDSKGPVFATAKKSPLKLLPFILGGLLLIGVIIFAAMRFLGNRNQPESAGSQPVTNGENRQVVTGNPITLEYWGLWEPSEVLTEVLKEFETQNPGVTVKYTKQSHKDYRQRLQTAIAGGTGPDVFRFHASWTPMLAQDLGTAPSSVISTADFQKNYYPIANSQLQVNGQIVGIPLMYDGLALYYNKDIFRTANVQPPKTWPELKTLASQLTVNSDAGIERGGVAIGNATNVEHFSDIIALLILQNGGDLKNPNTQEGRDAMLFYTNFVKVDKVWSDTLPSSTVAFSRGDVAMMFAPSWRVHEIKALNPQLNFGIASLPKLQNTDVTWGSYWAEGVNAKGKQVATSWKLIQFLSQPETLKKLYSNASEIRAFGELYPRTDMASELSSNEYAAPYLSDAKQAQGGFLSSYTHDTGLNDVMIKYYQDGVTGLLNGKSVDEVMTTIDQGTKQSIKQYNVK